MTIAYVVDTSYLLELLSVPSFSSPAHSVEVKARFRKAADDGSRLYVPVTCLFELANHIADICNGNERERYAGRFHEAVFKSLEQRVPWTIMIHPVNYDELESVSAKFHKDYVGRGLGLTDSQVICAAHELKKKYTGLGRVHIWTKDRVMKSMEPDQEEDSFVG